MLTSLLDQLVALYELGGPVVLLLATVSVATLALVLYKLWQFSAAHVGHHAALRHAAAAWDAGDHSGARTELARSRSYLRPVLAAAFEGRHKERLEVMAEARFAQLERGFRYLDAVAQLAPLLGLFGTVLGMIEAFRALQAAGTQVDPSILAGGIWVALLTTAVGLVVAMPASLVLTWFDGRMARERLMAERLILTVVRPSARQPAQAETGRDRIPAHV